jgi:outer membrane protein assembly factor BamB
LSIKGKWGRIATALVWVAVLASGCMGGRSATITVGWTAVAADDTLVVGVFPTGLVVALDPSAAGKELWSYPVATQSPASPFSCSPQKASSGPKPFEAVYGQPILTDELVVFGSYDGSVYALSRDTNVQEAARQKWSFATEGAIVAGVALFEDTLYFGSVDHKVYAINLADGSAVWSEPFETGEAIWSTPAVDAERVFVGSMDHAVYALDRATGQQLWRTDVMGAVPGSVTLADDQVYVVSLDKKLHALRASDGSEVWATEDLGAWPMSQPTVRDGYVYVATLKGDVFALSTDGGAERWPAIAVGSAVRATPIWVGEGADSRLVVATEAGELISIDVQNGMQSDLYAGAASALADTANVGTRVYIGTTTGQVVALDTALPASPVQWTYPTAEEK